MNMKNKIASLANARENIEMHYQENADAFTYLHDVVEEKIDLRTPKSRQNLQNYRRMCLLNRKNSAKIRLKINRQEKRIGTTPRPKRRLGSSPQIL